jgi:hypothetical protein
MEQFILFDLNTWWGGPYACVAHMLTKYVISAVVRLPREDIDELVVTAREAIEPMLGETPSETIGNSRGW